MDKKRKRGWLFKFIGKDKIQLVSNIGYGLGYNRQGIYIFLRKEDNKNYIFEYIVKSLNGYLSRIVIFVYSYIQ